MSLKFVILGSGSSMGVPRADGYSGDCDLKNKKNFRTRCSALIKFNDQNILIDTSPDLRSQLLSNKIRTISKVINTMCLICVWMCIKNLANSSNFIT